MNETETDEPIQSGEKLQPQRPAHETDQHSATGCTRWLQVVRAHFGYYNPPETGN